MSNKSIYSKNLIHRKVIISMDMIGSNLINIIQKKISKKYEGKCSKEGYIKRGSIEIVTYSSGVLQDNSVVFDVSFECLICRPVEGMRINIKLVTGSAGAGDERLAPKGIKSALDDIAVGLGFFADVPREVVAIAADARAFRYRFESVERVVIAV